MAKVPGPPPEFVRRRRNKDEVPRANGERRGLTSEKPLTADPNWRIDVRNYFNAALHSGQSDFYENSDVMTLWVQCELLDRVLRQSRTVPLYKREQGDDGEWHDVLDEDGNPVPELDSFGEPDRRTVGNINGQALKAILDMGQDLLVTEGARRRLRIDLGYPKTDEEDPSDRLVEKQRSSLAVVKPIKKSKAS